MKSNPWFRMYHEFATDPKIQMLSEADQRRFIMLLCMRCCNGDETLHDEEIAFHLRISSEEWGRTKGVFTEKKLINERNQPTAWNKRQYVSDSSTERVRRHREKKKQKCNVSVTPPEQNRTETDTEKAVAVANIVQEPESGDFEQQPHMILAAAFAELEFDFQHIHTPKVIGMLRRWHGAGVTPEHILSLIHI